MVRNEKINIVSMLNPIQFREQLDPRGFGKKPPLAYIFMEYAT